MQVKGAKEAEALIILMNYLDDNLFGLYWKVSMSYKSCESDPYFDKGVFNKVRGGRKM